MSGKIVRIITTTIIIIITHGNLSINISSHTNRQEKDKNCHWSYYCDNCGIWSGQGGPHLKTFSSRVFCSTRREQSQEQSLSLFQQSSNIWGLVHYKEMNKSKERYFSGTCEVRGT
ncbi:hypothetical protein ElyMa_002793000 [Elysia marginata]|uniref:Uncharacterized protein n=1 Tax=Elysia marginata TaxID=1093978 RepID=A0AAV4HP13_9GAST|nr:hypothetical protein ElyMa_002793000 [Elysia marginata]